MARVYKRNKLGQFSKGGATSKGNRTVSKVSISAKAAPAAIENIAVRASSKSSGKGTSSIRVRAPQQARAQQAKVVQAKAQQAKVVQAKAQRAKAQQDLEDFKSFKSASTV